MTDLSQTIAPKSDRTNADDLIAGPIDITVTDVRGVNDEQPIAIDFTSGGRQYKPWHPCKSMRRVLVAMWGKDGKEYIGRSMRIYCDPEVKFSGIKVGGIRISHMSHIDGERTMALTASKAVRKAFTVRPMEAVRTGPDPQARADAIEMAERAASCGTEAFRNWFNSPDGKEVRHLFKDDADVMANLKAKATEADEEPSGGDENG